MASDRTLLDATALLALLFEEKGAERVKTVVADGRTGLTQVSYSRVVAHLAARGYLRREIDQALALGIEILPTTDAIAHEAGELARVVRPPALAVEERFAIATAKALGYTLLTGNPKLARRAKKLGLTILDAHK